MLKLDENNPKSRSYLDNPDVIIAIQGKNSRDARIKLSGKWREKCLKENDKIEKNMLAKQKD